MNSKSAHKTTPAYKVRPKGATFEGYPELNFAELIRMGSVTVCPGNDWLRRFLRRS